MARVTCLMAFSSAISGSSMASRPAVSMMTVSRIFVRASSSASRAITSGLAPSRVNTGTSIFSPSTWSWVMAAGR